MENQSTENSTQESSSSSNKSAAKTNRTLLPLDFLELLLTSTKAMSYVFNLQILCWLPQSLEIRLDPTIPPTPCLVKRNHLY